MNDDDSFVNYQLPNGDLVSGQCTLDILVGVASMLIESELENFYRVVLKDNWGIELPPVVTPDDILFQLRTLGLIKMVQLDENDEVIEDEQTEERDDS